MANLIRKPSELEVTGTVKILVYGQPGLGKTTLGLSSNKPLLLDFDGGVHRVNPMHQTDTLQVDKWEDVQEVLNGDLRPYNTLVFDTAGKMLDFMNVFIIKNDPKMGKRDGALSLQGYGARKVMFQTLLKKASSLKLNLVFIAHDKEDKNGETMFIRPEIGGSSSGDLIKELDLVGYMEANGKKRTISFDPCEKFYGKNTCQLDSLIEIPILTSSTNVFLSNIIQKYQDNQKARVEMVSEYEAIIELVKSNADECLTAEDCNEFLGWVNSVTHIWDSKLQAGTMINQKAKSLGFAYSKINKAYEAKMEAASV